MAKNFPKIDTYTEAAIPNAALADLLKAKGFEASADAPKTPPVTTNAPKPGEINLAKCGKLVVRRERKGRSGKTVTLVSGIERAPAQIEEIARALRKSLGCGSTAEGKTIVLQGDIVDRAQAWLQAHGATTVVQGT